MGTTNLDTLRLADNLTVDDNATITGNATVTGNLAVTGTLTATGQVAGPTKAVVASGDGAITIQGSVVLITKGSAAALTLAVPTAAQNGTIIHIIATTAFAHTVTATTVGFNQLDAAGDVGTFGGAVGDQISVVAYAGEWYVLNNINVTLG